MARKTSKFMIGLFVTFGVLIGMVAVVWLGASKYFEKGKTYVTFFDESVQGLQVDSAVKYRGVEVGRVEAIRVAPDNRLIEVVIKVDMKGRLEEDYVSQLRAAGITGIVFIELDRRDPEKAGLSPKIGFAAEYPIISSQPSEIKQIINAVGDVIDKLKQIDTQGISDQVKAAVQSINNLVGGEQMNRIVTGVESTVTDVSSVAKKVDHALEGKKIESILVDLEQILKETKDLVVTVKAEFGALHVAEAFGKITTNIDSATAKLDEIIHSGKIEEVIAEAKGVLVEAQNLIQAARGEIDSLHLSETVGKANQLLEEVNRNANRLLEDVNRNASRFLDDANRNTNQLLADVNRDTTQLLADVNRSATQLLGDTNRNAAQLLGDVNRSANQLLDHVDARTLSISNNLRATSDNLRRASAALEILIDRVSNNPPQLLFGEPTPPRKGR
jgi:phospholipid/cholesterol/gamma-HCH transport system substrate-binding protein